MNNLKTIGVPVIDGFGKKNSGGTLMSKRIRSVTRPSVLVAIA
jgi:hypothetical protein